MLSSKQAGKKWARKVFNEKINHAHRKSKNLNSIVYSKAIGSCFKVATTTNERINDKKHGQFYKSSSDEMVRLITDFCKNRNL